MDRLVTQMLKTYESIANRTPSQSIIGGMFGLAEPLANSGPLPVFLREPALLLANARSGLALILKAVRPSQIWLPSFLCDAVLSTIPRNSGTLRFYEIGEDLNITSDAWLNQIGEGDLLLLIDYFGFPSSKECARRAKAQGAWVLEDACQALFSNGLGEPVDFVLYSTRKFLGVPDGGVLIVHNRTTHLNKIELQPPPEKWWLKAFRASVLRRDFDSTPSDREWFELFRMIEAEQPCGPYAMSELTHVLLTHSFDYEQIARRRIENYEAVAKILGPWALRPSLLPGVVPLGFPIRIRHRDEIRSVLFEHRIYPPVHWPVPEAVPEKYRASRCLAAEIMTLPCDQRYRVADLQWMAKIVLQADQLWN